MYIKAKLLQTKHMQRIQFVKTYLLEEMLTFHSYYYPTYIPSKRTRVPRNNNEGQNSLSNILLSIFNYLGHNFGKFMNFTLDERV